ncbi:hypothetical protein GXM_06846 [Nostoc sphaeroides CCNUC1]|uniref:Uncharacterized protein n=1 Tax=Nostoc sphaeroides CCNUC1 TaxID=2653204 RepID=A0A5P8W9U6_9NOSO|nr:hypothetical protein GXM_06846 [Nostoc sphaeroides CCNUC1]
MHFLLMAAFNTANSMCLLGLYSSFRFSRQQTSRIDIQK